MTRRDFPWEPKRVCSNCGSEDTYTRTVKYVTASGEIRYCQSDHWCRDGSGGWLCHDCRLILVDNPKETKESRKKRSARHITYKGKRRRVPEPPRIGVCNWCRAVAGEINTQRNILCDVTHVNHEEYHDEDPLKDAIELCVPCHRKYHIELIWSTKDRECIACYNKVGEYKRSWSFNDGTPHIICDNCLNRYIKIPNPKLGKIRKERWIGKDSECYGCGLVVGEKKDKKWVFNDPTPHVLCGNCDSLIRYHTRKHNLTE